MRQLRNRNKRNEGRKVERAEPSLGRTVSPVSRHSRVIVRHGNSSLSKLFFPHNDASKVQENHTFRMNDRVAWVEQRNFAAFTYPINPGRPLTFQRSSCSCEFPSFFPPTRSVNTLVARG